MRAQCRETRRTQWLEDLLLDARFTCRALRAAKAFSLLAILTLALGIGANTAFFSTAYGILFRPLPYPEPERLVEVVDGFSGAGPVTALRALSKTADYAGYSAPEPANLQLPGESVRAFVSPVSFNLARVLGVSPQLGRWFTAADERSPTPPPVVLAHHHWRTRFQSNPAILHQLILLDEKPHQVIGVMPASFSFPSPQTDLWRPINLDPRLAGQIWGNGGFNAIGRLLPHATLTVAQSEICTLAAATLLLPIACGNLGNLLLARGIQGHREFALREALGASRTRLLRQLLTENLVLVLLGGAAGLLCAFALAQAIPHLSPNDTPRLAELSTDPALLETANPDWPQPLKPRYPDLVIADVQTRGELRAASVAGQRSTATLLALCAALGLLLGIAGVHGVVAHRAAQRTKELGIRLALGATPLQLLRTVMAETVIVSLAGAAIGVAVAYPACA